MARSIRIEYEGAYYHVMARGNQRSLIFLDDDDRNYFLKTLEDTCEKTGWRVHAWVLMGNHYHLFIETPEANLVAGMKWLQNSYTRRFNIRHKKWGRIFGDRYKAILVEGNSTYYYETMINYIHLNPVRARLVKLDEQQTILDYRWSSLSQGYALPSEKRKKWMVCSKGLNALGFSDTLLGRQQMLEYLERRAIKEEADRCGIPITDDEIGVRGANLRKGWYWGTEVFCKKILEKEDSLLIKPRSIDYRSSFEKKAHNIHQAEILLTECLLKAGMGTIDLKKLKGSDPCKVFIAAFIKRQTTVSNEWVAKKLAMKSAGNVSYQLKNSDTTKLISYLPSQLLSYVNQWGQSSNFEFFDS